MIPPAALRFFVNCTIFHLFFEGDKAFLRNFFKEKIACSQHKGREQAILITSEELLAALLTAVLRLQRLM